MSEPIRVAVVGLGIGRAHLEASKELPERFEIIAVCDLDAAKAEEAALHYGAVRHTTELGELLEMDGLEVVDLCTPPHLHFAQIGKVLRCNKAAHSHRHIPPLHQAQWASHRGAVQAVNGSQEVGSRPAGKGG